MYKGGIKLALTKEEIQEAIKLGKKEEYYRKAFFRHYKFGTPVTFWESGMVFTKFSSLVFYSHIFGAVGKSIKPEEISAILLDDNLGIIVSVVGTKANFLSGSWIHLEQGRKIIGATQTSTEKQADPGIGFLSMPYHRWYIKGFFPYSKIDLKAVTKIVVTKGKKKSIFYINLSRCK